MSSVKTVIIHGPLMMSLAEFAALHGISESTARQCANGVSENYPPLTAVTTLGGKRYKYVTAEAAAEWRASLPQT